MEVICVDSHAAQTVALNLLVLKVKGGSEYRDYYTGVRGDYIGILMKIMLNLLNLKLQNLRP